MTSLPYAAPVARDPYAPASRLTASAGILPSACTAADNQQQGQCFGVNGPIPGSWNCQACCALREAISWQNPATGAAAACR